MRRKNYVSEGIGNVAVYWEDLQRIIGIVRTSCSKMHLEVNDVEYETLEEVREHCGTALPELEIEGNNESPYRSLSVDIKSYGTYIRTTGNDDAFVRATNEIRLVLAKRRRVPTAINGVVAGVTAYLFAAAVLALIVLANLHIAVPFWLWVASSFLLVIGHILIAAESLNKPKILLQPRQEAGFMVRNRDDVLKLLLAALVGAIITLVLRKVFGM